MKLKRNKKGQNDFSLVGLTLGQIMAIRHALSVEMQNDWITPVGKDVLIQLKNLNLETIKAWGV